MSLSVTPTPSAGWDVVVLRVGGAGTQRDAFGGLPIFLERFPASCSGAEGCGFQGVDTFPTTAAVGRHSVRLLNSSQGAPLGGVLSRLDTDPKTLVTAGLAPATAAERAVDVGVRRRVLLEQDAAPPPPPPPPPPPHSAPSPAARAGESAAAAAARFAGAAAADAAARDAAEARRLEDDSRHARRLQVTTPYAGMLGTVPRLTLTTGTYRAPVGGCQVTIVMTGGGGGGGACSLCSAASVGGTSPTFSVSFWNDGVVPFSLTIGTGGGAPASRGGGGGGGATAIEQPAGTVIAVAAGGGGGGSGAGGAASSLLYRYALAGAAYTTANGGRGGSIGGHGAFGTTTFPSTAATSGSASGGGAGGFPAGTTASVAGGGGWRTGGTSRSGTSTTAQGSGGGGGGGFFSGGGGGAVTTSSRAGAGGGGGMSYFDSSRLLAVSDVSFSSTFWGANNNGYGGAGGTTASAGRNGAASLVSCVRRANYTSTSVFTTTSVPNWPDQRSAMWQPPAAGCHAFALVKGGGGGGGRTPNGRGGTGASVMDVIAFNGSMVAWAFPSSGGGTGGGVHGGGGGASALQISQSPFRGFNVSRSLVHLVAGGGGGGSLNSGLETTTASNLGCAGGNAGSLANGDGAFSSTVVALDLCRVCGGAGGSTSGSSGGLPACSSASNTKGAPGGPYGAALDRGGTGGKSLATSSLVTPAYGWADGGTCTSLTTANGGGGGGGWYGGGGGGVGLRGTVDAPGGGGSSWVASPSPAGYSTSFTRGAIIWPGPAANPGATGQGGLVALSCSFPMCGAGDGTALYSITIKAANVALPVTVETGALRSAVANCGVDIFAPAGYVLDVLVTRFALDAADLSVFAVLDGSSVFGSAALLTGSGVIAPPFRVRTSGAAVSLRFSSAAGARAFAGAAATVTAALASSSFGMCAGSASRSVLALSASGSAAVASGSLVGTVSCLVTITAPANFIVTVSGFTTFALGAATLSVWNGMGNGDVGPNVYSSSPGSASSTGNSLTLLLAGNGASAAGVAFTATAVAAAPAAFTSTALVVERVGSGPLVATTNGANPVFLDEVNVGGAVGCATAGCASLLRTHRLPGSGAGVSRACAQDARDKVRGGFATLSADGTQVLVSCYDATEGALATSALGMGATPANAVNRVIARVGATGVVDTSLALSAPDRQALTGAASDGTYFWAAGNLTGAAGGASLVFASLSTGVGAVMSGTASVKAIGLFFGVLYATQDSALGWVGGAGGALPTSAETVGFTRMTNGGLARAGAFVFQTPLVAFVCDAVSGVRQFFACSTAAVGQCTTGAVTPVGGASGCVGLAARTEGSAFILYATTTQMSANSLYRMNAAAISTTLAAVYTAAAGTQLLGVLQAPSRVTCQSCVASNPGTGFTFCSKGAAAALNTCVAPGTACAGGTSASTLATCQAIATTPAFSACTACLGAPASLGFGFCTALSTAYPNQCAGAPALCDSGASFSNASDCDAAAATIDTCGDCTLYRPGNGFYWCNTPADKGAPRCMSTSSPAMCGEMVTESGLCVTTVTASASASASPSFTGTAARSGSAARSPSASSTESATPSGAASASRASLSASASWATASPAPTDSLASTSASESAAASASTSASGSYTLSAVTASNAPSSSASGSPSFSASAETRTPSASAAASASATSCATPTRAATPSSVRSRTVSGTMGATPSMIMTRTTRTSGSPSRSGAASRTPTSTALRSGTVSPTASTRPSTSARVSQSLVPSKSSTRSARATLTPSATRSSVRSPSPSPCSSASRSSVRTTSLSAAGTASAAPTTTRTMVTTVTTTNSQVATRSQTALDTVSLAGSASARRSTSATVSGSSSGRPSNTRTAPRTLSSSPTGKRTVSPSARPSPTRTPLRTGTASSSSRPTWTRSGRATPTRSSRPTLCASASAKASTVSKSAAATRPVGTTTVSATATASRAPPFKVPTLFSMPGTSTIGVYAIQADTSTRTSSYVEGATGACSYDGSSFFIATADSPALFATARATTAQEFLVVNRAGAGAWGASGRPVACHVKSGLLYVAVADAVANTSAIYAPTPALPTAAAPATAWTPLVSIAGTSAVRAFALSGTALTVFLSLPGTGVARCDRSGLSALEAFSGCQVNAAVKNANDLVLSTSMLTLYIVTPNALLALAVGHEPYMFASAALKTISTAPADGREYRGVGLADLVIPTTTAARTVTPTSLPSRTVSRTSSVSPTASWASESAAASAVSTASFATETAAPSADATPSAESSHSSSSSASASASPSASGSESASESPSSTSSPSGSPDASQSANSTFTARETSSGSATRSETPSISRSAATSATASASISETVPRTASAGLTETATLSPSPSVTRSANVSRSSSASTSDSQSVTPTLTLSALPSGTVSPSDSVSPSASASDSASSSPSRAASATGNVSRTVSATHSLSARSSPTTLGTFPDPGSRSFTSDSTPTLAPAPSAASSASSKSRPSTSQEPSVSPYAVASETAAPNGTTTASAAASASLATSPSATVRATSTDIISSGSPSASVTESESASPSASARATVTQSASTSPSASSSPWHVMTAGNVLALQVGDKATGINKGLMAPVYLVEFTTALPGVAGAALTPVQSFLVPGVTLPDNDASYGALSLSLDGTLVVFAAFGAAAGSAVGAALGGIRAIVAVNRWGYAKTRYVSGPGVSTVYAAATCDNAKFYLTTSAGIYSTSYSGQAPLFEGPAASFAAFAAQCVGNTSSPRIYAGASTTTEFLRWLPARPAGGLLGALSASTIASQSNALLRGFSIVGFDATTFRATVWTADFATGVSRQWFVNGVGWTKSLANAPAGLPVLAVLYLPSAPARLWVSTSAGVYLLDLATVPTCTTTTTVACPWLNLVASTPAPVLLPVGGVAAGRLAGLAPVPTSPGTAPPPRPFTAGNFLAVRVGDGVAALSASASSAPVFLEEYTPLGALVQAVKLTGALVPAAVPFALRGTNTSTEGFASRSNNGYFVALGAFGAANATGVIARVINSGGVDFSTRFTPTSPALSGVAAAAVSNGGDSVWFCNTVGGRSRLAAAYVGAAGGSGGTTSDASTAAPASSCAAASFMPAGLGGSANALWIARDTNLSFAAVSAPTTLAGAAFTAPPGLDAFTALRGFVFISATELFAADFGVGVWHMASDAGVWSSNSSLLIPCAAFSVDTCTETDTAAMGVVAVEYGAATKLLYVSTLKALYCVDVSVASAPAPVNNFLPVVAPRAKMELRGLVLAPVPPPGGTLVYPASTTFTQGSLLALRAESASAAASRLFVDEINAASATILQTWLLPSAAAGQRATLPGAAGPSGMLGQLTATTDGKYVVFPAFDEPAGFAAAPGAAYGHTLAKLSCRGSAVFAATGPRTDTWFGAGATAADDSGVAYVASSAGLLFADASGALVNTNTTCAGGFAGVSVLGPAAAPTVFALSKGCGVFTAAGAPPLGFAPDVVTTTLSAADATTAFAPVAYTSASSAAAEYFYATPSGLLLRSAFVSGGAAASRGAVAPSATQRIVGAYGAASATGLAGGIFVATTAGVYSCASLACGPGASAFSITSAVKFRTTPGLLYAADMACNITVELRAGFLAGVTFSDFNLESNDFFAVSSNAGSTTLLAPTTGTAAPSALVAAGERLAMSLATDSTGALSGVYGTVTAVPYTCSNGTAFEMLATALVGSLSSPATLRTQGLAMTAHGAKKRCDFRLVAPGGSSVRLQISSFNIGAGSFLTLYEGGPQGDVIARLSRASAGNVFSSGASSTMYATFVSGEGAVGAGIVAAATSQVYTAPVYEAQFIGPATGVIATLSQFTLTESGSYFQSTSSFPGNYPATTVWLVTMTAPNGYYVNWTFTHFDTEPGYDIVVLYDGLTQAAGVPKLGFDASTRSPRCPPLMSGRTTARYRNTWCASSGPSMVMRFVADDSVQYSGINGVAVFNYLPTTPDTPMKCVSGIASTIGGSSGGWLVGVTHHFVTGAAALMNCTVTLTAPAGYVVALSISSWEVRASDFFTAYDGPSSAPRFAYPTIVPATSTQPAGTIYSTGNSLTVTYTSRLAPLAGIAMAATPVLLADVLPGALVCTRTVSSAAVALASGDAVRLLTTASQVYGNDVGCAFTITAPADHVVQLSFSSFVTQYGKDLFSVFDGESTLYAELGVFSGSSRPANVSSSGPVMHVTFTSDKAGSYAGVVALARALPAPVAACVLSPATTIAVTSASLLRTSAAGSYPAGLTCTFLVTAPFGFAPVLSYSAFDVAAGGAWSVYDGTSAAAPALTLAATGAAAPPTVSSSSDALFIKFTSGAGTGAGVVAAVAFVPTSACRQLAAAAAGSSYISLGAAPFGCGWNDRRLAAAAAAEAHAAGAAGRTGAPPAGAPCHVDTPREECLLPVRSVVVEGAARAD